MSAAAVDPGRIARAAERLVPDPAAPAAFFAGLGTALQRGGVPFDGACWHLTDPVSGVFTWSGAAGRLPDGFERALENELFADDVAKLTDVARRPVPVASLHGDTGGEPRRSERYRTLLRPDGFADELRVVFADPFGRWGSLCLFGEQPFGAAALRAAAALVRPVAAALREKVALVPAAGDDAPPGFLLLDARDRIVTRDARAEELLTRCAPPATLPGAVHVLAAQARTTGRPARGRTLAATEWLMADVSPVVDADGEVAVVLRPAPAPSLLEVRLRAAGLTRREREIALLVLRGDDTRTIAAALHLSPWTVQDHLKAVFAKTGVRSRRAFAGAWAFHTHAAP